MIRRPPRSTLSSSSAASDVYKRQLLYAINGGIDARTKVQVGPEYRPITSEYLDYDEVLDKYDKMMDWLAGVYVRTLNVIHYMHDKYYYEAAEMALIDTDVRRTFATGIAGFSHVVDSLSAIKYAKVCLLYTSDAADEEDSVDLGGRRIIKKKKK